MVSVTPVQFDGKLRLHRLEELMRQEVKLVVVRAERVFYVFYFEGDKVRIVRSSTGLAFEGLILEMSTFLRLTRGLRQGTKAFVIGLGRKVFSQTPLGHREPIINLRDHQAAVEFMGVDWETGEVSPKDVALIEGQLAWVQSTFPGLFEALQHAHARGVVVITGAELTDEKVNDLFNKIRGTAPVSRVIRAASTTDTS